MPLIRPPVVVCMSSLDHQPAAVAEITTRLARLIETLLDWRLFVLMALNAVLLLLAAQWPLDYRIQVGDPWGSGSDQPFLRGFYPPESPSLDNTWRWMPTSARFTLPGVGKQPLEVDLTVVANQRMYQPADSSPTLTVDTGSGPVDLPLRVAPTRYRLYVPADAIDAGVLRLQLNATPWNNPGDPRDPIGVALGKHLVVRSLGMGLAWPDLKLLGWPLGIGLLWLAARVSGLNSWAATATLIGPALALPLAALVEIPRLAVGGMWAIQAGGLTVLAAGTFAWFTPRILRRFAVPNSTQLLPWLVLALSLSFFLKYTGQLYIDSMPGDRQLHINRYTITMFGDLYIRAQHRGLPFPFPNAPYILLAPFTLTGIQLGVLFELSAAIFECAGVLLIYMTVARLSNSPQLGFFAALTATAVAVGHMNTWYSFQTQVASQFYSTLLLTLLVLRWPRYDSWAVWGGVTTLFIMVFLGHIGSLINTAMLGLLIIPVLWWRARDDIERRGTLQLFAAGLAAAAFVAIFYYTAFWDLVMTQVSGVADGGLLGVTGREPVSRAVIVSVLWNEGLTVHFGMFPVILALAGAAIVSRSPRYQGSILPPLLWLTFVVALTQGLLPLITLSSITTRWLTFAGWAICVASAFALNAIWQRGRAGRIAVVLMYAFVAWQAAVVWANAMFLRLPPPEPF
jgi:hypothetical protein